LCKKARNPRRFAGTAYSTVGSDIQLSVRAHVVAVNVSCNLS
jgi:hypothetical protein